MRGLLGFLFLIKLISFFHLGNATAKNTGNVHPFKTLFFRRSGVLSFFKCRSIFWGFNFLYDWRRLSPMENSGCFYACFSFLFLLVLKLPGNRASGFSVLQEAVFLGLCDALFWMRYRRAPRRLLFFSIFGQRFTRKHHGARRKRRRINGVLGGRLGPRR